MWSQTRVERKKDNNNLANKITHGYESNTTNGEDLTEESKNTKQLLK